MSETKVERVLAYVAEHGEASIKELSEVLGVDGQVVKAMVRKLGLDGRLRQKITYVIGPGRHKKVEREPVPPTTDQEMAFFRKGVEIWGQKKFAMATGMAPVTCAKLLRGDIVSDVTVLSLRKIVEGGMERVKASVEAQERSKPVPSPRRQVQGVVEDSEGAGGKPPARVRKPRVAVKDEGHAGSGGEGSKSSAARPRKAKDKHFSPEREAKAQDLLRIIGEAKGPMRLSEVAVALGKRTKDASSYFKVAEELVSSGKLSKDPSVTPASYGLPLARDTTRKAVGIMGITFAVEIIDKKIYKEVVLTANGQPRMSRACHDGNIEATTEALVTSIRRRLEAA